MNKLIFALISLFFIYIVANSTSIYCGTMGNNTVLPNNYLNATFSTNEVKFNNSLSFVPTISLFTPTLSTLSNKSSNVSYYLNSNNYINFIYSFNDELNIWKLNITGNSQSARTFNIKLNSTLLTFQNSTCIVFGKDLYFSWNDSRTFFSKVSNTSNAFTLQIKIPKGIFNIDPTFGSLNKTGTTASNIEDWLTGTRFNFTGGNNQFMSSITAMLKTNNATKLWNITFALYKFFPLDQTNKTLVAYSIATNYQFVNTSYYFVTINFSTPVALINDTEYVLMGIGNNDSTSNYLYMRVTEKLTLPYISYVVRGVNYTALDGIPPTNWTATYKYYNEYLIYATYFMNMSISNTNNVIFTSLPFETLNISRTDNNTFIISNSLIKQFNAERIEINNFIFNFQNTHLLVIGNRTITLIFNDTLQFLYNLNESSFIINGSNIELPYLSNVNIVTIPINSSYIFIYFIEDGTDYFTENPHTILFNKNKVVESTMINTIEVISQTSNGLSLEFILGIHILLISLCVISIFLINILGMSLAILGLFFSSFATSYVIIDGQYQTTIQLGISSIIPISIYIILMVINLKIYKNNH